MTLLIILIVISNYVYLLLTNCKTIKIKHIYTYLTTGWMKIGWEEKKKPWYVDRYLFHKRSLLIDPWISFFYTRFSTLVNPNTCSYRFPYPKWYHKSCISMIVHGFHFFIYYSLVMHAPWMSLLWTSTSLDE